MTTYTQAQLDAMSNEQLIALGMPVATDAPYVTGDHVPGYDGSTAGSGLPALPKIPTLMGLPLWGKDTLLGKAIDGGAKVVSGAKAGLNFITDIPRVATTIIGGLLIAAAIFAIAGGSRRDIIQVVTKGKP